MIIEVLKSSPLHFIQILDQKKFDSIKKRSIHLRPLLPISLRKGLFTWARMNFALGSYEKFLPDLRDENWEKAKDLRDYIWRQIRETKLNMTKHKNFNFRAYHSFGNSSNCITVVKWDAYIVENAAGNGRRCHPDRQNSNHFHPCNRAEVHKSISAL